MQRNIVETALGALVLLVAGGFMLFFMRTTDIRSESGGYTITASFSSVDGLQTGAPVRISGIQVGQVAGFSLEPDTYAALVKLRIDEGVKLPLDTSAVVASAGLLDGKFLTLQPGADEEMLAEGGTIEHTQSTASLEQLLGQVIFSMNKDKDTGPSDKTVPEMP